MGAGRKVDVSADGVAGLGAEVKLMRDCAGGIAGGGTGAWTGGTAERSGKEWPAVCREGGGLACVGFSDLRGLSENTKP